MARVWRAVWGLRKRVGLASPMVVEDSEQVRRHRCAAKLADCVRFGTETLLNADLGPNHTIWSTVVRDRIGLWRKEVVRTLADYPVTESDKLYFENIVSFDPRGYKGISHEYARVRERLAERLRRLQTIIGRLEAPISKDSAH